jgi:hypothetical protein
VWEPKGLQAAPAWPQGSWGGAAGDAGQAGWEFAVIIHMAWAPATRSGLVGGLHSSPTFASNEQQAFVPTSDRVEQIVKGFVLCWRTAGQAGAGGGDLPFGTWKQMYQESFLSCLALAVSSAERWWLWCRSPAPPSTRQLPLAALLSICMIVSRV